MKGLSKAILIISKIVEIFHWIGAILLICMTLIVAVGRLELLHYFGSITTETESISAYGFTITITDKVGRFIFGSLFIGFITLIIVCILIALIFKNIYRIFKTSEGRTRFSEGPTPFQQANVQMLRKIGVLCILLPVVQIIMSVVALFVIGFITLEIGSYIIMILMGLVAFGLSHYFEYGISLREKAERMDRAV